MSARRRWVYTEGGRPLPEPVEVSEDWSNVGLEGGHKSEEEVYGHITATDGTDLSSRRRHREYMRANGLALADDYRESWTRAEERRGRACTEGPDSKTRRESIERAIYTLTQGKRAK